MREHIHQYLSEHFRSDQPGASIAIVKDGEIFHRQGYGLANVEWQIPHTTETVFRIASLTKSFTAVAIMLLAERGKVAVEDDIAEFFPDLLSGGQTITIAHLLNHTSGLRNYIPDFPDCLARKFTPHAIYERFAQQAPDSAPGERWNYNNLGYHLLGMIIESASGQTYENFLQDHIFTPLEMHGASYIHSQSIIPKRASGYDVRDNTITNADFIDMSIPYASGALGASVDDLVKWDKALRDNRLISAETQQMMRQPARLSDGSHCPYGYGWFISRYRDNTVVHHSGGIEGFSAHIMHVFDDGAAAIVLSNNANLNPEPIALACLRFALDIAHPNYSPVSLSETELNRAGGNYEMEKSGRKISFIAQDSRLECPEYAHLGAFHPFSETDFYCAKYPDVSIEFNEDFSAGVLKFPFNQYAFKQVQ